ncbi:MAG: response regulator [Anaerolineae bacterium]|nr:response regulator [Anaerolineae bacterium]
MDGRVLIIEDYDGNRQVLRKHFEAAGFEVAESKNGEIGVKDAIRLVPQVILVSTSLPDISGTEVARRLRAFTRTQHAFIMLLADEDSNRDKLSGLALGVNDFILSPFDPDEVTLRVRNALRRANMANRTDPTTGLPAGMLVQDQLRRLVHNAEGTWALLRFQVRNLDPFREAYGFMAGEDLLRGIARILAESLAQDNVEDDFLGYGGNDDFIVITSPKRAQELQNEVLAHFEQEVGSHYGFFEREKGYIEIEGKEYALAKLHSRCITPKDGPFYDIRSLTESLAG